MRNTRQALINAIFDVIAAAAAWALFYAYRKTRIESVKFGSDFHFELDQNFYYGLAIIPLFWLFLYAITGTYKNPLRKSRLSELGQTLLITLIGVIVIFFTLLLDDTIYSYRNYYKTFLALFTFHAGFTAVVRFVISTSIAHRIQSKKIFFPTVLIGSNQRALDIFHEMENEHKSSGNRFIGFIHVDSQNGFSKELIKSIPKLGDISDLKRIIEAHGIEEVIIAIESSQHDFIGQIMNELDDTGVIIKIIPSLYDILSGSVKMTSIFGAPLIEISRNIMPEWQKFTKRAFDITVSVIVLLCFSWLYLLIAIIIKLGSKGPVFYSHERIGIHGKPFTMYKFRSMYTDAEKNGPQLSSKSDPRITPFGRFLRKVRLDEIPQFFNVLIGDMSIVGPRPERKYFIDLISQKAPHYRYLHKVKPGITSWGQVKFGYAENVDEMVERLKYDLLYIENMSLIVDFKILIYTFLIVIQGRGK